MPTESPDRHFAHRSRSFSLAARLFTPDARRDVVRLYRFCRYVDDLADAEAAGRPGELRALRRQLLEGGSPESDPILHDFLVLCRARQLPLGAAEQLLAASEADCGARQVESEAELLRFASGVAGTVGRLMQPIIGAEEVAATPFAIDLGIAFQLTNVARDIAEDARLKRVYLPRAWIAPETVYAAVETEEPGAVRAVDLAVERLLALAERYYESAGRGLWFIPRRNRRAVFLGLRLYRAIGLELRRRGSGAWLGRTYLSTFRKLALAALAYPELRKRERVEWTGQKAPIHDASLHESLLPVEQ